MSTQLNEIPIRIGIIVLAKKKNENNKAVKYVRLSTIGIKTALIPVKMEKTKHKSDECFFVYPPKHSQIAAPAIDPKKGPRSETKEYIVAFANLPSWPKTFWK